MKLLLVLRVLAVATAFVCTLLSLTVAAPLGRRLRTVAWLAGLAGAGAQLAIEIERILGRRAPWTKLLFPAVGIAATGCALIARGDPAAGVRAALLISAPFELAALGVAAVVIARALRDRSQAYPEEIVERELTRFAPGAFTRFLVAEPTIVLSAIAYVFGGFRRALPDGFSYVRTWSMVPVLIAAPVLFLPEGLVFDFILAHTSVPWGWRAANAFVHVYSALWLLGILAMARLRPHRVDAERVRFRFSVLKRLDVERRNIASVRTLGPILDTKAFRTSTARDRAAYAMVLDGSPAVDVTLHRPVEVSGMFGGTRLVERLIVAVDEPHRFVAALA
jgi:hypothetical protein